jgi:hypothetical protein
MRPQPDRPLARAATAMTEQIPDPTPIAGSGGGRRAAVVLAVAVVLVAVAVWKPWQDASVTPAPSPTAAEAASPVAAASTAPPASPAAASPVAALPVAPSPDPRGRAPFTTPPAPRAVADWSAIRWRRLAPDDPAALVRAVVRFDGGYLALGPTIAADGSAGPAWASPDGASWTPLPRATRGSLWPDQAIVAATAVPGGVVALTVSAGAIACAAGATCEAGAASVGAWVSADGMTWAPQAGIGIAVADGAAPPLLTRGPAGLVAVSGAGASRTVALSANGGAWRTVPDALPWGFTARGLTATEDGYVAAGWLRSDGRRVAATATSADGERWTARPLPVPTAGAAASGTSTVDAVFATERRLLLVGRVDATGAGWDRQDAWWSGRDADALVLLPDAGPLSTEGEGAEAGASGTEPTGGGGDGLLAGDGGRIVTLAPDGDGAAWSSTDVTDWFGLRTWGDRPAAVDAIVLLPGGILARGPDGAWIGEALVPWPAQ